MRFIKEKVIVDENVKVDFFSIFIASGCYTGFAPKASGTFGSAFAFLFLLIPGFYHPVVLLTLPVIFFVVGIITSDRMSQRYGEDPSVVVIDEIVGVWISLLIISLFFPVIDWKIVVISFLTFRVFDILKIFPAKYFDKMHNGFGVMADDVVAAIYSGFLSVLILKYVFGL